MTWRFYADGESRYAMRPPFLGETSEPAGDCTSTVYLCPRCGHAWARIEIMGALTFALPRACEPCGSGRMLSDFELDLLADGYNWHLYPPAVLQRELRILLEAADGQCNSNAER